MRTGILRRHPWAVLWCAAVVTAVASVGRDLSDGGGAGIAGGGELAWLVLTVVSGLVCVAAILQLARDERAPHVPRRRRARPPESDVLR
ncbi:hypothetical protein [Actinotalea sp. Marseille-Q4924]|uniref:hypothetical protein n=1 Tax=Actinotalea sp. Marseille-Q4924 TaxID=2866571 RepID=UPI001CE49C74|nr:hypothetical protein [Actinotalea sp. Marseille-Q4924]